MRDAAEGEDPRQARVDADTPELREQVKDALKAEGFRTEIWQKPEWGMVFGMIRREDEMQLHVRYYKGGVVKGEREIAHTYLEHLISPRTSAHEEIEEILDRHDVDGVEVREKRFPSRMEREMPSTRTPWKPFALGLGTLAVGTLIAKGLLGRDQLR